VIVPFSVNLLALLARLSRDCRKRVWSAWMVPRSVGHSMTRRLPFFVKAVFDKRAEPRRDGGRNTACRSPARRWQSRRFGCVRCHETRARGRNRATSISTPSELTLGCHRCDPKHSASMTYQGPTMRRSRTGVPKLVFLGLQASDLVDEFRPALRDVATLVAPSPFCACVTDVRARLRALFGISFAISRRSR
jgi:hypothetical protein